MSADPESSGGGLWVALAVLLAAAIVIFMLTRGSGGTGYSVF